MKAKEIKPIMEKTAEQFVIERCRLVMNLDGTDIVLDSIPSVARMAESYAEQENDKLKVRLKKRITDWNSTSIEVPPSYSWKDIFELIDKL